MDKNINIWDLTPLAKSDTDTTLNDSRLEAQKAIDEFAHKWQRDNQYTSDPSRLKTALEEYEKLMAHHGLNGREWYYLNLRSTQDQIDPKLKGLSRAADEVATKQYNQIQFFLLNVAKIKPEIQSVLLESPELVEFKHFLSRLFSQQHYLLSEPEEKILNLVSQPAHQSWVAMTSTFLSKEQFKIKHEDGKVKETPFTEVLSLTNSQNKEVRDEAADIANQTMAKYAETATEELNAILQFKKTTDELRHYSRPDMDRHISDDIESEVVDSLLQSVSQQFNLAIEYYQLKAELFQVEKLAYHERNIPYGHLSQEYDFSQASALVEQTLSDLDTEFGQIFSQFLKQGQFDVFPRPGKAGGAFCAHNLVTQPTYILLNHTNKLQDVLTLAHEMGHGLHNEMARKYQNSLNFGTSLATAEVASTFMEDFVMEQLLKNADKTTQLEVMMMKLNDDVSSIFRQVACYRFEQALHRQFRQQGYLSSEEIGRLFQEHMAAYMGSSVEQSEGSQNWWVYWSHIRNFFYVYSYASGLLISKSLQALVRQDAKNIQKVKQFMTAGQSDSPRNIFLATGIDIQKPEFWQQGLSEIKSLLDQTQQLAMELKLVTNKTNNSVKGKKV